MRRRALIASLLLSVGLYSPFVATKAQQIQTQQGIAFITGGVGLDEREAIEAMAGDFSLKLRFALKGGSYIADVQVRIQDEQGEPVLESAADGPWFLVDLAPGKYTVLASDPNEKLQRDVQVQQGRQTEVVFHFKDR